jgi:ABC-type multidrug transport system permease subunit
MEKIMRFLKHFGWWIAANCRVLVLMVLFGFGLFVGIRSLIDGKIKYAIVGVVFSTAVAAIYYTGSGKDKNDMEGSL